MKALELFCCSGGMAAGFRAGAILQGFPEGWRFEGKTKSARWAQLGMAMPPPLAAAVARSVRRALEGADERGAA